MEQLAPLEKALQQNKSSENFMEANTQVVEMDHLSNRNIIPVFAKDNEPTISHPDFIESCQTAVDHLFSGETILQPAVRVSHPIKGRIPEARNKPAKELQDHERTLYWERMMFVIEIPSITEIVGEDLLHLTVGGVRAYNQENLHNKKSQERFKVFIGFQNKICTNLCVWTDGLSTDIRVTKAEDLSSGIIELISDYDSQQHVRRMNALSGEGLSENKFAQLVGRSRMYQHLPKEVKGDIPELKLLDSQINTIVREYYGNSPHARESDGSIDLWKLYNLFTSANKSSYIDSFLERGANAHDFSDTILNALAEGDKCWFLN